MSNGPNCEVQNLLQDLYIIYLILQTKKLLKHIPVADVHRCYNILFDLQAMHW